MFVVQPTSPTSNSKHKTKSPEIFPLFICGAAWSVLYSILQQHTSDHLNLCHSVTTAAALTVQQYAQAHAPNLNSSRHLSLLGLRGTPCTHHAVHLPKRVITNDHLRRGYAVRLP